MTHKLSTKQKGFTIVEVLIVLAIAGVIMLVVFLAVPALQRSSRNTQRKSDVNHLMALINEYKANNNNAVPTAIATSGSGTSTTLYTNGEKFSLITVPTTVTAATAATTFTAPTTDTPQVYTGASCNGNNAQYNSASTRSVAIWYYIEGTTATTQCVQS